MVTICIDVDEYFNNTLSTLVKIEFGVKTGFQLKQTKYGFEPLFRFNGHKPVSLKV